MSQKGRKQQGRKQKGRRLSGILLLDKPEGMSSNAALQRAKRAFNAQKAGHTGSLDPMATGMLPVCFGEATKVSSFLLNADKTYQVTACLGKTSSTGDAEGEITDLESPVTFDLLQIQRVLDRFMGEIEQVPPMYSALKHNGERLYDLARQGKVVEREPRKVTIYEIELLSWQAPDLELKVRCSKGTYIRTLVEDIGLALDSGAYVTRLRRLAVGVFTQTEKMLPLAQIEQEAAEQAGSLDNYLLPVESALQEWPQVQLSNDSAYYLMQGQAVQVANAPTSGWVRIFTDDERFIGMGQILDDGRVAPKRIFDLN